MKANEFDLPSRKEEAKINSRLQEAKNNTKIKRQLREKQPDAICHFNI